MPLFTLMATQALAGDGTDPLGPSAPDPVLEWAERDLRRHRTSQVGLVIATTSPGLLWVGLTAVDSFPVQSYPEGHAVGVGLTAVGAVGAAVGPPLLLLGARGSARALQRQGLTPSTTPAWVGLTVDVAGALAVAGILASHPDGSATPVALGVGTVAYVGAVGMGGIQRQIDHRARRDAGWLGWQVLPTTHGGVTLASGGVW